MTLNGVVAVTLRYFTEFGKPALQKTICGGIYARVYCIFSACTMSLQRKFTFAISSPDEFLVATYVNKINSGDVGILHSTESVIEWMCWKPAKSAACACCAKIRQLVYS